MSLIPSPSTFDTDHVFTYVGQEFDKKASVGVYSEDAAALSAESKIKIKHDPSGTAARHLIQRTVKRAPSVDTTAGLRRITINFTITADPLFSASEVAEEVAILKGAIAVTDFVKNMMLSKP